MSLRKAVKPSNSGLRHGKGISLRKRRKRSKPASLVQWDAVQNDLCIAAVDLVRSQRRASHVCRGVNHTDILVDYRVWHAMEQAVLAALSFSGEKIDPITMSKKEPAAGFEVPYYATSPPLGNYGEEPTPPEQKENRTMDAAEKAKVADFVENVVKQIASKDKQEEVIKRYVYYNNGHAEEVRRQMEEK